ncbi:hypothetical protein EVJ58_g7333 [Rhodofomes roseus]|uniref:Uncharacterized protein n=1 Tax=Rhodofomes roseus TaxID=34475 RepID=A0A4Y9Y663_9APHY|nr:hypothetical protein EVJ58_g7333 [Rhodofomes roseus]
MDEFISTLGDVSPLAEDSSSWLTEDSTPFDESVVPLDFEHSGSGTKFFCVVC